MKAHALSGKQSIELFDTVGKILAIELESATVKSKVKKLVADYVKKKQNRREPSRFV